jgi:hypothetical protein
VTTRLSREAINMGIDSEMLMSQAG